MSIPDEHKQILWDMYDEYVGDGQPLIGTNDLWALMVAVYLLAAPDDKEDSKIED